MQDFDLDHLRDSVLKCISQSKYSEAMEHIKAFVEQVINDPESGAVVFASRELDDLCQRVADAWHAARTDVADVKDSGGEPRGTVILASELVMAGGHVELIKDYLSLALFEAPVRIALTDMFNRMDRNATAEWSARLGCEVFVADAHDPRGKLDALSQQLDAWNPATLLTMGHNQDVICVVAAHHPGVAHRYYIHHGDHHLSLGVTCEAFHHVDLHNMSYELCKRDIGVIDQRYWPITSVRPASVKASFLERGALTTCSCGRMSKFEAGEYAFRYERAVALMLKASGGYHVHIGELSEAFLAKIHAELDAERVSHERFRHIEWVPSLSAALVEQGVDVFVGSFPIGGGKALIEAMSVGVAVVTHESYRSRYHASFDLAYPESFIWRGYDDLVSIFGGWDAALLKRHSDSALQYFQQHYSQDAFLEAFASGVNGAAHVPPLRAYHPDRLRNYLDVKRDRVRESGEVLVENKRLFSEWKTLHTAYEANLKSIALQQERISYIEQEKRELQASCAALEQEAGGARPQGQSTTSFRGKFRRLLGRILEG